MSLLLRLFALLVQPVAAMRQSVSRLTACPSLNVNPALATCGGAPTTRDVDSVGFCSGPEPRFCEVLIATDNGTQVFNPWGCNFCPKAEFNGIQEHKIGPYYIQMDTMWNSAPEESLDADGNRMVRVFNGLQMHHIATKPAGGAIYEPDQMKRDSVWKWGPGRQVYQLVTSNGTVYTTIMSTGPTLFSQGLLTISETMDMPEGWTHRCKVLGSSGLELNNGGSEFANIMQDANKNIYQLTPEPTSSPDCARYTDDDCIVETSQTRQEHCQNGQNAVVGMAM